MQPDDQPRPDRGLRRPHRRGRAAVAQVDGPGALRPPVARRAHDPLPPRRRRAVAALEGRARPCSPCSCCAARRPSARCGPAPSGMLAAPTTAPSRRSSTRWPPAAPSRSPCALERRPGEREARWAHALSGRRRSTRPTTTRRPSRRPTHRRRRPARRPAPPTALNTDLARDVAELWLRVERLERQLGLTEDLSRRRRSGVGSGRRTGELSRRRRRRAGFDAAQSTSGRVRSGSKVERQAVHAVAHARSAAGRRGRRGRGASRSAGSAPRCAPCRGCGPRSARRRRPPWARRSSASRCPTRTSSTSRTARRRTPRTCTCRRRGCQTDSPLHGRSVPGLAQHVVLLGVSRSRHSASVFSISAMTTRYRAAATRPATTASVARPLRRADVRGRSRRLRDEFRPAAASYVQVDEHVQPCTDRRPAARPRRRALGPRARGPRADGRAAARTAGSPATC